MSAAVVSSPSPLWYLTRGSGIITLILLTASICLGIASSVGWRGRSLPRFVVAGLHRNLTLLAVTFLAIHVATTLADTYTPIGLKDALVPFTANYRPIWLGLGALASDLLLALVLTSLIRVRIGYRVWRATHWLAYASWPLALVHSLGTGSDARFGWMALLALSSTLTVVVTIAVRVAHPGWRPFSFAAIGAAAACALGIALWYRSGPAQPGWAARAGTPGFAPAARRPRPARKLDAPRLSALPRSFAARLSGRLIQSLPDASGLITVSVDARLQGQVRGRLRLALRGAPTDDGGVSMSSSGVAFEGSGPTAVYEGSIVALDGANVIADLRSHSGSALRLVIVLRIAPGSGAVSGSIQGART